MPTENTQDNYVESLEAELESLKNAIYCPTCGACGEAGCCPPDRCNHLICFYGEHYAKTYRELEVENARLRAALQSIKEVWENMSWIDKDATYTDKIVRQCAVDMWESIRKCMEILKEDNNG